VTRSAIADTGVTAVRSELTRLDDLDLLPPPSFDASGRLLVQCLLKCRIVGILCLWVMSAMHEVSTHATAANGVLSESKYLRYQEEVFNQAHKGNAIVVLRPGSGKTYISVMVIRHVASKETKRNRTIIFLVPKVALVAQQAKYIADHTGLKVGELHGSSCPDMADMVGWKRVYSKHHVLVMTGEFQLTS
jgi:replicative superfamily II helicase